MYKVVIVEDEENILKSIEYMVSWERCDCVVVGTAWNGKEGLKLISEMQPDVVITDVRMPFVDGLEMIKRAQEFLSFESIIISGYDSFDYAKTAIRLGVNEYILKPIDYEELEWSLERTVMKIEDLRTNYQKSNSIRYYSKRVKNIIDYIDENIDQKITLTHLCDVFNISSTSLNTLFKKEVNTTVNDYINRRKIEKSIELIKTEQYLLYEIADKVGYSNYKYFGKVFKKYTKKSPSEFMKSNRLNESVKKQSIEE